MKRFNCFLLGAGLANSVSAFQLRNENIKPIFYDENDFIGGRINSIHFDENIIELGAQFFSSEDLNVTNLVKELNLNELLLTLNLSNFFVLRKNKIFSFSSHSDKILTKKEKKALIEFYKLLEKTSIDFIVQNEEMLATQTFQDWIDKTIGLNILWLINSITKSITFSLSNEINALYGLLVVKTFFDKCFTLKDGLLSLVKELHLGLNAEYHFNSTIKKLEFDDNSLSSMQVNEKKQLNEINFSKKDIIISSLPAPALKKASNNKSLNKVLSKIKYKKCLTSFFLIKEKIPRLNGFLLSDEFKFLYSAYIKPLNTKESALIVFSKFNEKNKEKTVSHLIDELNNLLPFFKEKYSLQNRIF